MTISTLTTQNLTLRAFSEQDAEAMYHILSGQDVLRYFPTTQPPTLPQVQKMIDRLLKHWEKHGYGLWAVELRETGDLVGRCGLQYIPETDEIEIDFILGRQFWGQGFATEAGKASLQFGFEELNLTSIVGIVHVDNLASQRVLQKLGMHLTETKEYFGMMCQRYLIENS